MARVVPDIENGVRSRAESLKRKQKPLCFGTLGIDLQWRYRSIPNAIHAVD